MAASDINLYDTRAYFSNYAPTKVHIAAPGVSILSTYKDSDSSYALMSGTSMATPLVAGAAALLFAAKPTATAAEVRWGVAASNSAPGCGERRPGCEAPRPGAACQAAG